MPIGTDGMQIIPQLPAEQEFITPQVTSKRFLRSVEILFQARGEARQILTGDWFGQQIQTDMV